MYFQEFYYWCRDAVRKIKYIPDRNKVYRELRSHMEDRYRSLLERGISPKEAEQQTLAAMGDANEIADQLAAIHRPFWGYALAVARFLAVVLTFLTLGNGIWYFYEEYYDRDKELRPLSYNLGERILTTEPNVSDSSDGYTFRIKEAGVWRVELPEEVDGKAYYDQIILRMEVTNPLPWAPEQQAFEAMWVVDDAGVYHRANMEYTEPGTGYMGMVQRHRRFTTWTYDIWLSETTEDAKWVELHYDRDGRDLYLRVDLTGGGEK